jgi:fructose-specific phosphotransferase system IIA component
MTLLITDVVSAEMVALELESSDRDGAIRELAALIDADGRLADLERFVDAVLDRERLGATGMEMGIAIPHGKSMVVIRPAVAIGRSSTGIDFGATDGSPATLIFMIAAPDDEADLHLRILARLARRLVYEEFRARIASASTEIEIVSILEQEVEL